MHFQLKLNNSSCRGRQTICIRLLGIAAIAALFGLYIGERVKVIGENCP